MSDHPDDLAAAEARDFVGAATPRWRAQLGAELIGVYLLGSLAHGGFSRRYSDIDVGLITEAGLAPAALEALRATAEAVSGELARKLSFFWADRRFSIGRFPPLDRADYLDHGVTLFERERVEPQRPALAETRAYLAGAPFANWAEGARAFAAAAALDPADRKSYLRAHLYPARFVLSFMTGRMASNDDAVAFLRDRAPPGLNVGLIARALECRRAAADPDPLFSERALLPRQVAAIAQLVTESAAEAP